MASEKHGFFNIELSKKTSIFNLPLWVIVGICFGACVVVVFFLISLWFTSKRSKKIKTLPKFKKHSSVKTPVIIPNVSKEIQEIRTDSSRHTDPLPESGDLVKVERKGLGESEKSNNGPERVHIKIGKDHRISYPGCGGSSGGEVKSGDQMGIVVPEVSHLGWGHWYTLRELEVATNWFADENVIGEGGYGIVYSGVLVDNTKVAVKNLLNNR